MDATALALAADPTPFTARALLGIPFVVSALLVNAFQFMPFSLTPFG